MMRLNERLRIRKRAASSAKLLVESIRKAAMELLRTNDLHGIPNEVRLFYLLVVMLSKACHDQNVDRMLELVGFGRFLRNAVHSQETFDFSLAHAIIGWVRNALSGTNSGSDNMLAVSVALNSLEETISLTSGRGLVEIWMALFPASHLDTTGNMANHLESADRRLSHLSGTISKYPL